MKKTLFIAFTALLLIVGSVLYLLNQPSDQLSNEEERAFAIKSINKITKIHLANSSGDEVHLVKTDGGKWLVNNQYIARENRIELLLHTAENIAVQQKVPESKMERVLKNLATDNIIAEFYEGDEIIKTYYVGKANGQSTGTYMLLKNPNNGKNASTPYLTYLLGFQGYLTPRYEPHPKTWRNLNLLYYPKLAIGKVNLTYPNEPQKSFELKLQENKYELFQNGQVIEADQTMIKKYLLNFKNVYAERIITDADSLKSAITSETPWFVLQVENLLGKSTTIKGYKKKMPPGAKNAAGIPLFFDPDRFYGICFDNELSVLQYYVFDPLIVPIDLFK